MEQDNWLLFCEIKPFVKLNLVPILYPLKTPENLLFSRGLKKEKWPELGYCCVNSNFRFRSLTLCFVKLSSTICKI